MCGIAGRFHPIHLSDDADWAVRADALLAHRGPDGHGYFRDRRCELVHRRLAIIDRSSAGAQPMTNEDGSVRVVFNGEIYNHRELRAELEARGHKFRSAADTEVLVHLYEEHESDMLSRLNGMFAFAIYDEKRGSLLLARDGYGIKPLFYAISGQELLFASEMKAILARRGLHRSLDRQACYDYLGLGYVPEAETGFEQIRALGRGSFLRFTATGRVEKEFQILRAVPDERLERRAAVDEVEASLVRAVGRQCLADVPVAALLSGGIDSSLIVSAYVRVTGGSPLTYNVRFPSDGYDETNVARAVSERCGSTHKTIDASDVVTPEKISDLLLHFDQPFADMSLLPTYWVTQAIRDQGIVCVLSGDGGDEAFGGYARFWRAEMLRALALVPSGVRSSVSAIAARSARVTELGRNLAKALILVEAAHADDAILIAGLSNYLSETEKQELVRPEAREGLLPVTRYFTNGRNLPATLENLSAHMTENLFAVGLPGDMLRKVDMMSMRASVEVRVPMLDDDVVRVGLKLRHRLKTDGRRGKLVLRDLARRWLPREVAEHPKHGFQIPLDQMLGEAGKKNVKDSLLAGDARTGSFLDHAMVRHWLRAFERGEGYRTMSREGVCQRVFILYALELWLREQNLSW